MRSPRAGEKRSDPGLRHFSLQEVARALGGEISGKQVLAPGPGHSTKDRSLCVLLGQTSDGQPKLIIHSFAGDDWRECEMYVHERLGLPSWMPETRDSKKAIIARIWSEGVAVKGTPGEQYLREARGIDTNILAGILFRSDAIRWNPSVLFRDPSHALNNHYTGAIIGLVTDPITAKPIGGISRTFIHDGRKIAKAMSLGPIGGGVVRLSSDEDVLQGLFVCEGLESTLAALSVGLRPAWCVGGTSGLRQFPVLAGIEDLTIIADADPGGQEAAAKCAERWLAAGRGVRVMWGPDGTDINDVVRL
jgi:putative DNA primase/helicase